MAILGSFGVFPGNLELVFPDVLATVLSNLEVLLCRPGLSLVARILSGTGIRVVFGLKSGTDCESFTLVGGKCVNVAILGGFGVLSRNLELVFPDVLTSIFADHILSFFWLCSVQTQVVLAGAGVSVVLGFEGCADRESLVLVGGEGVNGAVLGGFGEFFGPF